MPDTNANFYSKLLTVIYLAALVALILLAWFPQPCSVIRKALDACSRPVTVAPVSSPVAEVNRYTHDDLTSGSADFTTKAQDPRHYSLIDFEYRADLSHQTAYIELHTKNGYQILGLITNPLLTTLTWPKILSSEPNLTLYNQSNAYTNLDDFKNNLPAASSLAADIPAATLFGLNPSQYTNIDSLTSLQGITAILTTYSPQTADHTWRLYSHTFDLESYQPETNGNFNWRISAPKNTSVTEDFLLGQVHIDYQDTRLK